MSTTKSVLFSAFFLLFVQVYSQLVPAITSSKVTQKDAQASLDFHNKIRADVNVPPLNWSGDLAKYAQKWADYLASNGCNVKHRPPDSYGENIAWYSGDCSALDACESRYSELKDYVYGPVTSKNDGGHYTQMVWQTTTLLGIGIAYCKDGGVIVVANYSPPGNCIGKYPYEKKLANR